jgi:hypothetical protein
VVVDEHRRYDVPHSPKRVYTFECRAMKLDDSAPVQASLARSSNLSLTP